MDEQLKKILVQFLQLMLDGIEKGANFAGAQIPLVVQEKLRYELISYLIWGGIWTAAIVGAWILARWAIRKCGDDNEVKVFFRTSAGVVSFIGVLCAGYYFDYALMIYIAPRVYILEWLKDLIK